MSTKLKRKDESIIDKEKRLEENYENMQFLCTLFFIISASLMVFDLVANIILEKPVEIYFYMRFLIAFFGLYGTLIVIGGNVCKENFEIEFTCCCGKMCDYLNNVGWCHIFFGGIFLITSYCIELCSLKIYYDNRDKIFDEFIIWLMYLLFIFSSITIILFCFLIINKNTQKKMKQKYE